MHIYIYAYAHVYIYIYTHVHICTHMHREGGRERERDTLGQTDPDGALCFDVYRRCANSLPSMQRRCCRMDFQRFARTTAAFLLIWELVRRGGLICGSLYEGSHYFGSN